MKKGDYDKNLKRLKIAETIVTIMSAFFVIVFAIVIIVSISLSKFRLIQVGMPLMFFVIFSLIIRSVLSAAKKKLIQDTDIKSMNEVERIFSSVPMLPLPELRKRTYEYCKKNNRLARFFANHYCGLLAAFSDVSSIESIRQFDFHAVNPIMSDNFWLDTQAMIDEVYSEMAQNFTDLPSRAVCRNVMCGVFIDEACRYLGELYDRRIAQIEGIDGEHRIAQYKRLTRAGRLRRSDEYLLFYQLFSNGFLGNNSIVTAHCNFEEQLVTTSENPADCVRHQTLLHDSCAMDFSSTVYQSSQGEPSNEASTAASGELRAEAVQPLVPRTTASAAAGSATSPGIQTTVSAVVTDIGGEFSEQQLTYITGGELTDYVKSNLKKHGYAITEKYAMCVDFIAEKEGELFYIIAKAASLPLGQMDLMLAETAAEPKECKSLFFVTTAEFNVMPKNPKVRIFDRNCLLKNRC